MTPTAQVLEALAGQVAADPLLMPSQPGHLDFIPTKTDGTHIALVSPDRTVEFKGVIWVNQQGVK